VQTSYYYLHANHIIPQPYILGIAVSDNTTNVLVNIVVYTDPYSRLKLGPQCIEIYWFNRSNGLINK